MRGLVPGRGAPLSPGWVGESGAVALGREGEGRGGEGRVCGGAGPLLLGLGCLGEGSLRGWLDSSWGISPLASP